MVLVGFRHPGIQFLSSTSVTQGTPLVRTRRELEQGEGLDSRESRFLHQGSRIRALAIRALASKGRYGEEDDDRARCARRLSLGWGGAASGGSGGKVRAMRSGWGERRLKSRRMEVGTGGARHGGNARPRDGDPKSPNSPSPPPHDRGSLAT